jgi:ABC-type multidrug transport system ATPase subunit
VISLLGAIVGARRGVRPLGPLSLDLGIGAHAFVGGRETGGARLLAILAGEASLESGTARVLGAAPHVRKEVAYVPLACALPAGHTVVEALALAAAIRGGASGTRSSRARLDAFDLTLLADRRVESLDAEEVHTIALVEAITSAAEVLLLDEPLARTTARASMFLLEALRQRAREATVLVTTASDRDARALDASIWRLHDGAIAQRRSTIDAIRSEVHAFRLIGSDLRPLAAALASDARAEALSWQGPDLVVRGAESEALASALGACIASSGVAVDLMEPVQAVEGASG